ncbi:B3 domain-containing transcription factor VRN1 [Linum perenne]
MAAAAAVNDSVEHRSFPSFFRVILPCVLEEKKLKLPLNFARAFGKELGPIAKLWLPTGYSCEVTVEKGSNDDVWLSEGWSEFVDRFSISNGFFLVFDYLGESNRFNVQIFDLTTCSIRYPSVEQKEEEDDPNEEEQQQQPPISTVVISDDEDCELVHSESDREPITSEKRVVKRKSSDNKGDSSLGFESESCKEDTNSGTVRKTVAKRRRKSPSNKEGDSSSEVKSESCEDRDLVLGLKFEEEESEHNQLVELVKSRGICTSAKFPSTIAKMYNKCSKGVKAAALMADPKTPCFIVVMSARQEGNTPMTPTIPALFMRKHIPKESKSVTLVNKNRERWRVDTETKYGAGGLLMGYGWTFFCRDNKLSTADVCLFQLASAEESLFEVSVFHVAD